MWTFDRYKTWLERRTNFYIPGKDSEGSEPESAAPASPAAPKTALPSLGSTAKPPAHSSKPSGPAVPPEPGGRIEIDPEESPFGKILKRGKD
jgi:hypothetical protein